MLQKIKLYYDTMRYLKPSQIYYRVKRTAKVTIKFRTPVIRNYRELSTVATLQELDFDKDFLRRFPISELMKGKISFLHQTEMFDWDGDWKIERQTALWNFNLHYFEYLHSLTKIYLDTGRKEYLKESKKAILGWIQKNPVKDADVGWASYTIAMRLTNWLSFWTNLQDELEQDTEFAQKMVDSIYEQYSYLSKHLEKDLLGNHYFEDLKALVLCALFFRDNTYEETVLQELKKECKEQILKDGMHFELSPMYHKLIFEDVLRVAWALRCAGRPDEEIEVYIKPMADVAYTFENGLARIPLFNDGGNNVAKSLKALENVTEKYFNVKPEEKDKLKESGYYFFRNGGWKLIVDAGQPGPDYIPGHAHCDAMSFELFLDGKPVLVNSGTYAYQCKERSYFRSTKAHNTVMINDIEQSQCWGAFRLGKRASIRVLSVNENSISMEMVDQKGQKVIRYIEMNREYIKVKDSSEGKKLRAFIHLPTIIAEEKMGFLKVNNESSCTIKKQLYSSEYGAICNSLMWELFGNENIEFKIKLEELYNLIFKEK